MRLLILSRNATLYSTSRLVLAARSRGHHVSVVDPLELRIVISRGRPSLFLGDRAAPHTDLVLTFPIMSDDGGLPSNWYEKPSFPLFFRNVLYILGNVDDSVRSVSVQPGEPVVLRPEAGFRFIELTTPAKRTLKLARGDRNEITYSDTESVGIYRYQVGAKDSDQEKDLEKEPMRGFAVNLLDANESNIEPRSSIRIGNERIVAGEEKLQTREIWKWILLLAVVLLVTEWFIYQRRIAV